MSRKVFVLLTSLRRSVSNYGNPFLGSIWIASALPRNDEWWVLRFYVPVFDNPLIIVEL